MVVSLTIDNLDLAKGLSLLAPILWARFFLGRVVRPSCATAIDFRRESVLVTIMAVGIVMQEE